MNRSQDESLRDLHRFVEQATIPLLNLSLTKDDEFMNCIESSLGQENTCNNKSKDFIKSITPPLTPPKTPKTNEKPKAMNFPISKITIGDWTREAKYPDDLKAKIYFAKKRLMWESLEKVDTGTKTLKLKRKIEMQWADVLSLNVTINSHDQTEILEIELKKRPTFFMETNPQAGKHTQWKHMDQDFTFNQSASKYRRHTLHFAPGVLLKNIEKLVSSNNFWSNQVKVKFPTLKNIFFDVDYEDINNNLPHHSHGETLCFNHNNVNDHLHHHSQGFGHVPMGESNFNMPTQLYPTDGLQVNSFVQDNRVNDLLVPQVFQQPYPLINEPYSNGGDFTGSQFNNHMIQDEFQMRNPWELGGSQPTLLETQTNSMMFPHMNGFSTYPPQVGPYLGSYLAQEEETQHMEHTHHNGNFQTNNMYLDQFPNHGYDQYFGNNNVTMPPPLL